MPRPLSVVTGLLVAALAVSAHAIGSKGSLAVVWLEEGRADTALEAELVNVLLTCLAEADLSTTVASQESAMVRRAVADGELGTADVGAGADAAALARLARGMGVDWVVGLSLETPTGSDTPADADVVVTGVLVDAVTGDHTELRAENRSGESGASRILASAMAYRVCEAVAGGIAAGRSTPTARAQGPEERQPGIPASPLHDAPGGIDDVTVHLEERIHRDGASAELCLLLGDAYRVDGQWKLARTEYQKAATLDRTLPDPHIRLGEMASDRGLWQDAIKEYKIALELDPANTAARIAMARALEQSSQRAMAVKQLEVATDLAPDNGALWVKLGDIYRDLEQPKEAEEAYLAALQSEALDPQAYGRLGQLHAQRGRFGDALTYYVQASKHGAGQPPLKLNERHYEATMGAADESLAQAMRASRDAPFPFKSFSSSSRLGRRRTRHSCASPRNRGTSPGSPRRSSRPAACGDSTHCVCWRTHWWRNQTSPSCNIWTRTTSRTWTTLDRCGMRPLKNLRNL